MDKEPTNTAEHTLSAMAVTPPSTPALPARKDPESADDPLELLTPEKAQARSNEGYALLTRGDIKSFNTLRGNFPMWRPDFSGKSFRSMNLTGARLDRARLIGTDFTGTNLEDADFWLSNLTNAQLSGAHVQNTSFYLTTLDGANLQNTNLSIVKSIIGASLKGAQLQGANVQTDITNVQFHKAIFDERTQLPEPEAFLKTTVETGYDNKGIVILLPETLPEEYKGRIKAIIRGQERKSSNRDI